MFNNLTNSNAPNPPPPSILKQLLFYLLNRPGENSVKEIKKKHSFNLLIMSLFGSTGVVSCKIN